MDRDRAAASGAKAQRTTASLAASRNRNAIFYVMRSGCPWRLLPGDLPPWTTVYRWFVTWRDACVFEKINHALVVFDRECAGREASPTVAIIDSQSVKTTEAGGPRGYDAGKKVKGRKRHALVDTDGRALLLDTQPASIQDRDGGGPLLSASSPLYPFIARVFADSGYNHERVDNASKIAVEIVKRIAAQVGFVVLPRRWVVERFFAETADWRKTKPLSTPPEHSLRSLHHAAHPPHRKGCLNFETDSNKKSFLQNSLTLLAEQTGFEPKHALYMHRL
jgi:transposase